MKINDLFRTCNMYENIEPLTDEIKVFQCEEADETSSINSALSAMSLRSIANSRCNENTSVNEDVYQKVKRLHQMAAIRKESKDNGKDIIPVIFIYYLLILYLNLYFRIELNVMTMMMKKNMMKKKVKYFN